MAGILVFLAGWIGLPACWHADSLAVLAGFLAGMAFCLAGVACWLTG
jgi:hypothetical protein